MNTAFSRSSVKSSPEAVTVYMSKVYMWMTAGLALTALTAFLVGHSNMIPLLFSNAIVPLVLFVAEIGLVIAITAAIHKLSGFVATLLFLLFSFINGLTLSTIFLAYSIGSITNAFVATAGMFFAMSVYGTVTKRDLTNLGSFLFMGLLGILIAGIVNIFLQSSLMDFVISCCGVLIFTLYTAYDTQKLREFGFDAPLEDGEAVQRGAILGALTLYLDFINLFLHLLRLFNSSND